MTALVVTPLLGMPEVAANDDVAALVLAALTENALTLRDGDVLVVSSKIVSKAMGLTVATSAGDPATVREAVVASQTEWVVAERRTAGRTTSVVKARSGPVMAAAGVDASNTGGLDLLLLLPPDPDAVCRELHGALVAATGVRRLGVVLSDTAGRAWRVGQTDFALGAHGLLVTDDLRGGTDADGRLLEVTTRAVADEIAAAADLVKGKTYAVPVAHLRGLPEALVPEVLPPEADGVSIPAAMPAAMPGGATPEDVVSTPAATPGGAMPGGAMPGGAMPGGAMPGAATLVRTGPSDWFGLGRAEAVRSALGVAPGSREADLVGIASALPEDLGTRLARAVAVALLTSPDAGVDIGPVGGAPASRVTETAGAAGTAGPAAYRIVVSHHDPVDLGLVVGRLLVALHGEWLDADLGPRSDGSLTLDVVDR